MMHFIVTYKRKAVRPHQGFFCYANDDPHAREKCSKAYPDCRIIRVSAGTQGECMVSAVPGWG